MILLATLTPYGWTFLGIIAASILLARKILLRKNENEKPGCIGVGYVATVISVLSIMVFTLSAGMGKTVYHFVVLPKYKATVVDTRSYISETKHKGRIRKTKMFQAIVTFTDNTGNTIVVPTDIGSSSQVKKGEQMTVVYDFDADTASELSVRSFALIFGCCLMLAIMGYFLYAGLVYAFGGAIKPVFNFGIKAALYFLVPFGMLFLLGGLSYGLYNHYGAGVYMPLWAEIVCIFFVVVLVFGLLGYINMLRQKEIPIKVQGVPVMFQMRKRKKR